MSAAFFVKHPMLCQDRLGTNLHSRQFQQQILVVFRTAERDFDRLADALVKSHVEALLRKMPHPDAAILGCTHYPLMEASFQRAIGGEVPIFTQANLIPDSLADYLDRHPEMQGSGTQSRFLTTGDPQKVSAKAIQFFKRAIVFERA